MSATEDAEKPRARAGRPARNADYAAAFPLLGALAGTSLVLALLAIPDLLPDLPRYGCRLAVPDGRGSTEVRAADRASLVALGAASGVAGEARAARERLVAWREARAIARAGPPAPLVPAAECAARLRVRAGLAAALAGDGSSASSPPSADEPPGFAGGLERADRAVEQAVVSSDAAALRDAMRLADLAEAAWLADGFADVRERFARWQARERSRGEEFALVAQVIESDLEPGDRDLMAAWGSPLALEIQPAAAATLEAAAAGAEPPRVSPITSVWLLGALIGAALGALIGFVAPRAFRAAAAGPARTPARTLAILPASAPAAATRGLRIVCGARAADVARAACEMAGPALAGGERVLILDAGRSLSLDRTFDAASRWGVGECVSNGLPILGAVQTLGVRGLYLLSRGEAEIESRPDGLGRVAAEAHRHFSTVIVALDRPALRACGAALAKHAPAGASWASPARRFLPASAAPTDLGIRFEPLKLSGPSEKPLEALRAHLEQLAAASASHPDPAPLPGLVLQPPVVLAAAAREAFARLAPAPRKLESDTQTRERLRFLMWMRSVEAERVARAGSAAGL